jgi:hypothetical protein
MQQYEMPAQWTAGKSVNDTFTQATRTMVSAYVWQFSLCGLLDWQYTESMFNQAITLPFPKGKQAVELAVSPRRRDPCRYDGGAKATQHRGPLQH